MNFLGVNPWIGQKKKSSLPVSPKKSADMGKMGKSLSDAFEKKPGIPGRSVK
jgi:hypothetical protein